jgi:hypothetical protein
MKLPAKCFDRAEKKDKKMVAEIIDMIEEQYKPQPAIKGLKIAL